MNVLRTLPNKVIVAFSGGIDSSVMLHLALKNREVVLGTFDHKNETSDQEIAFAEEVSSNFNIPLIIGSTQEHYSKGDSKEKFWSKCRNDWFNSLQHSVVTGHNLDDALEWYLMTSLTGNGGYYMDYSNKNVLRPLLCITKKEIIDYATKYNVKYISDPTNDDLSFNLRNKVRHELVPIVSKINPGIYSTIRRNIIRKTSTVVI